MSNGPIGSASTPGVADPTAAASADPIGPTVASGAVDSLAAAEEPITVGANVATTDPLHPVLVPEVVADDSAVSTSGVPETSISWVVSQQLTTGPRVETGSIGAIPLPTTRVESPPIVDQAAAVNMIAGLYQRIASQQDFVDSYRDLEQAMRDQTRRRDRLEQELRSLAESASPFVTFAQVRCDRLRLDLKDALAEVALLRKEVHAGQGHAQQISDLKSKLLKTTRSLHASQERHDRELAALRQHMDEGNDRFEAALTQAADKLQKSKSKKSEYKTKFNRAQSKGRKLYDALAALSLERDQSLDALSVERDQYQVDLAELTVEYDRLHSLLSDRDDREVQLQTKISGLEAERDLALRDRDALRASIATLAAGLAIPPASNPDVTAPSPLKPPNVKGLGKTADSCGKRPRTFTPVLPPRNKKTKTRSSSSPPIGTAHKPPSPAVPGDSAESPRRGKKCERPAPRPPRRSERPRMKRISKTPSSSGSRSHKGKKRARNPTPVASSSDDDESSDAKSQTLAALARSRSSFRRKTLPGSPRTPPPLSPDLIVVDTPSPASGSPASPITAPPRPKTKVSKVDMFGEASSSSDGAISMAEEARAPVNTLLSSAEYDALPQTKVPRDQWIPGYRCRVPKSSIQVSPWSARRVSWISVDELDVDFFAHHLARPKHYPFPAPSGVSKPPPESEWSARLITSAQIATLYRQEPWKALKVKIAPVSFAPVGWFQQLLDIYYTFEDRYIQTLWESTHTLPISTADRVSDPGLALYCDQRKQRRSRTGPRWKTVLRFILRGMIEGHCDIDILLDPVFLHLPRVAEKQLWYPGLGTRKTNLPNLASALLLTNSAEPWRNQYRAAIADHPGMSIPRLAGKFVVL